MDPTLIRINEIG